MFCRLTSRLVLPLISARQGSVVPVIQSNLLRRTFGSDGNNPDQSADEINLQASTEILEGLGQNIMGTLRRPKAKKVRADRRVPIPWQTSVRYMESEPYKKAYGDYLVWQLYRRNFGGQFHQLPGKTRISCVGEDGFLDSGSPCPICRDEYLVLHYNNVKLLKQFINPFTGKIYPPRKTSLCRIKDEELRVAIHMAKDYGTLSFYIEPRNFDYRDYYLPEDIAHLKLEEGFDLSKDEVLKRALREPDLSSEKEYAIDNWQVIK